MDLTQIISLLITSIVAPALLYLLKRAIDIAAQKIENDGRVTKVIQVESIKKQFHELAEMAVATTSQTFVDELKERGEFTPEHAKEAFMRSKDILVQSATPKMMEILERTVTDINVFLNALIEQAVVDQNQNKEG